jgi:hypothetical protein
MSFPPNPAVSTGGVEIGAKNSTGKMSEQKKRFVLLGG